MVGVVAFPLSLSASLTRSHNVGEAYSFSRALGAGGCATVAVFKTHGWNLTTHQEGLNDAV